MLDDSIVCSECYLTDLGKHIGEGLSLLITSPSFTNLGHSKKISDKLSSNQNEILVFDRVHSNPELSDIENYFALIKRENIKNVVALGGGSVIDFAKATTALLSKPEDGLLNLIENNAVHDKEIKLITIPTTSGTGSEVTPFATIWHSHSQKKYSLNGICSDIVILDPSLTLSLPEKDTLYPALDAISHALESLWNKNATFISVVYAEKALTLSCEYLPIILEKPDSLAARKALQQAATLAGLAISTTKTALAHAISYPITLRYRVPHGLACSFSLIALIRLFTPEQLKLSDALVDKLICMIESLNLANEISHYVDKANLLSNYDYNLDPSRAGNFTLPISTAIIQEIIADSL